MSDIEVPWEEAAACTYCKQQGAKRHSFPIQGGTRHTLECRTVWCIGFQAPWMVETDSDGKVMVNEQAYKSAHSERLVARSDPLFDKYFKQIHGALDAQLQQETNKDN